MALKHMLGCFDELGPNFSDALILSSLFPDHVEVFIKIKTFGKGSGHCSHCEAEQIVSRLFVTAFQPIFIPGNCSYQNQLETFVQ